MNNYFGIGLDAKISLDFNNKRDEHPEKCRWVMARGGGGAVPEQAGSGMESGPVAAFPRAGGCWSRRPTRKRLSGGLVVGRFHVGTGSGKAEEEESACSEDEEPGDKLSQSSCVWLPQLEPAPARLWATSSALGTPLSIQLAARASGKVARDGPSARALHPHGRPGWDSGLLALLCPSFGCHGHLGNEPEDRETLRLFLCLPSDPQGAGCVTVSSAFPWCPPTGSCARPQVQGRFYLAGTSRKARSSVGTENFHELHGF